MVNRQTIFLSVIILLFLGCSTTEVNQSRISLEQIENNRRQNYVSSHPNLPDEVKQNILKGVIQFGMTREMVLAALGNPDNVQRSGDASGVREVWVYYAPLPEPDSNSLAGFTPADIALAYAIAQSRRKATYLFFVDGVFTSFREQ
jgi:hypothetical protein